MRNTNIKKCSNYFRRRKKSTQDCNCNKNTIKLEKNPFKSPFHKKFPFYFLLCEFLKSFFLSRKFTLKSLFEMYELLSGEIFKRFNRTVFKNVSDDRSFETLIFTEERRFGKWPDFTYFS